MWLVFKGKETKDCKHAVEAEKITNKEERAKIDEWNNSIDSEFEKADEAMSKLEQWLVDAERAEKFVAQEDELKHQLKMYENKLQMQAELASKTEVNAKNLLPNPALNYQSLSWLNSMGPT